MRRQKFVIFIKLWHKRGYQTYSGVVFVWVRPTAWGPKLAKKDMIFNVAQPPWKNVKLLSNKAQATQQNSSYSDKNNVAIRLIATFMPKFNEYYKLLSSHNSVLLIEQSNLLLFHKPYFTLDFRYNVSVKYHYLLQINSYNVLKWLSLCFFTYGLQNSTFIKKKDFFTELLKKKW